MLRIYFNTRADPNPAVAEAIADADKVIFSAGDLYTSVLPHLLVGGVQEALAARRGRLIFVLNLMTKRGTGNQLHWREHLEMDSESRSRDTLFAL